MVLLNLIFKYNYQFMSIFNILILMVIIHCVGVSVGGGSVFNILISSIWYLVFIFNIYIILITTMFTSLLVDGVIISLMLTMF